jgi:23S rRNA pseudouridine1911/1915/1917 synthase
MSRSQLQKLIKSGNVLINEKIVSPHYTLKTGDKIKITKSNKEETKNDKKKEGVIVKTIKYVAPLNIIDETDNFLIINKPVDLIVHGAEHIKETVLTDLLVKKYPKLKKIGEDPARPAIVHRLDKDVSGLMVIPKTQDFFDHIKKQFKDHSITKEYTALVYGKISRLQGVIDFPIDRSIQGYKMAALPKTTKGEKNTEGKLAITEFEITKKYINYTLLNLRILTGRTHQIRVHLSAYDHPIVGDNLYGTRLTKEKNKRNKLGRVMLVAKHLAFIDLDGQKKEYTIDLPGDFTEFLNQIK